MTRVSQESALSGFFITLLHLDVVTLVSEVPTVKSVAPLSARFSSLDSSQCDSTVASKKKKFENFVITPKTNVSVVGVQFTAVSTLTLF